MEHSPAEKNLGVLVDKKLNMSHQCVLAVPKATSILGHIKRRVASRMRELISLMKKTKRSGLILLENALVRPHCSLPIFKRRL